MMYLTFGFFLSFLIVWLIARKITAPDFEGDVDKIAQLAHEDDTLLYRGGCNILMMGVFTIEYLLSKRWLFITELMAPTVIVLWIGFAIVGVFVINKVEDDAEKQKLENDTANIWFYFLMVLPNVAFRSDYLTTLWRNAFMFGL